MSYWACAQLEANRERLALHCLGVAGYQTYLPRIRVKRAMPARKIVTQTTPLFPGYCFVGIDLQWHAARWSPGVHRLVLDGLQPAVPDKVIAELIRDASAMAWSSYAYIAARLPIALGFIAA